MKMVFYFFLQPTPLNTARQAACASSINQTAVHRSLRARRGCSDPNSAARVTYHVKRFKNTGVVGKNYPCLRAISRDGLGGGNRCNTKLKYFTLYSH